MAAAAGKRTNWFAIWISVAVVVVLVIAGAVVVWLNNEATSAGPVPESPIVNAETGAISVGDGEDVVDLYFDFYCPHCQEYERLTGSAVDELVTDGAITFNAHPVALTGLNAASGTDFSVRSANAMYCVAEASPDAALGFMHSVFELDPSGEGLSDEVLAGLAGDAGAEGAASCIEDRTYSRYVLSMTGTIPPNPDTGGSGTPTLLVNGEWVQVTGDPQADIVDRLG